MGQDHKNSVSTTPKFFTAGRLFLFFNLILATQIREIFGRTAVQMVFNSTNMTSSLNDADSVDVEVYPIPLNSEFRANTHEKYGFFDQVTGRDVLGMREKKKIEAHQEEIPLKEKSIRNMLEKKIHFSPSCQLRKKEKESIVNSVIERITIARSRSREDQVKIDYVLKSKGFRIEITQTIGNVELLEGAYSFHSHAIFLPLWMFRLLKKNSKSEHIAKRLTNNLIHEFCHASDALQNLRVGTIAEESISAYERRTGLEALFPFRTQQESIALKTALDSGETYIIGQFHRLLLHSMSGKLTKEEKVIYDRYDQLARKFYQPKLKTYFVPNPEGEEYKKQSESSSKNPIVLQKELRGKKHITQIYIELYEKGKKNEKGRLTEGYWFSGYTVGNIKDPRNFILAMYNDYVFELGIKETYLPAYSEKIKQSASPQLFTEYYLTMERYAVLREIHPEIIKAFFPKVIKYQQKREAEFLQDTAENQEAAKIAAATSI